MSNTYTVNIEVRVHNAAQLYESAMHRAVVVDGMDKEEAEALLQPHSNEIDVEACLIMLFDPGLSPEGTNIIQSSVD